VGEADLGPFGQQFLADRPGDAIVVDDPQTIPFFPENKPIGVPFAPRDAADLARGLRPAG
jgi:hypothetical protein